MTSRETLLADEQSMDTSDYVLLNTDGDADAFNPLLPFVANAIETLGHGTLNDIRKHVELDLLRKVSSGEIQSAIENGIKLELFTERREFKVCREFTTKQLKLLKNFGDRVGGSGKTAQIGMGLRKRDRTVMDYVKEQRQERRKKLLRKRNNRLASLNGDLYRKPEFSKYLCGRCKKSVQKEFNTKSSKSTGSSGSLGDSTAKATSTSQSLATYPHSNASSDESRPKETQKPEKSRLIVEKKNPMETEPPYYDIFT